MDIIKYVSNLGVKADEPMWLQQKVLLSNQIAFIFAFFSIFFAITNSVFFPTMLWIPIVSLLACFSVPFFNASGFSTVSRIIIVQTPFLVVILSGAFLSNENQPLPYGVWGLAISFLALVFVLFDYRERTLMMICLAVMILILLFFRWIDTLFEVKGLDYTFATGWFYTSLCTVTAVSVISLSLFVLQSYTNDTELSSQALVETLAEKQKTMEMAEATLKTTLEEVQNNRKEEQQRNWISVGTAHITELTRREDTTQLYDDILSYIVKYLKINQGALYTVEEDNHNNQPHIYLKSTYAYERKKHIDKRIAIGQGLVGQCYLEKTKTVLKKIPADYIKITSGLGNATPNFLAIVPLLQNNQVEGIIEVASFKALEPFELEFLEKAGENLASFIRATRTNEKTKILLAQSQKQTEEMRQQEEEMRQNMEELAATQEQQNRLQEDLREKVEQLERVKEQMEEQRMVERQKAEEQSEKRTKIMQHAAEQYKIKEAELLAKIEEQSAQIAQLQSQN